MKNLTDVQVYRRLRYGVGEAPYKSVLYRMVRSSVDFIRYDKSEHEKERRRYQEACDLFEKPIEDLLDETEL